MAQTGVVVTETDGIVTRYYIEVPDPTLRRDTMSVLCKRHGVVVHLNDDTVVCMAGCNFATRESTSIVIIADTVPQDRGEFYVNCMSP